MLGRSRKQGGFEYHFNAIMNESLHKGAVVHSTHHKHTRKSGKRNDHEGIVVEAPQNIDFLQPLHKKTVRVRWSASPATEDLVTYNALESLAVDREAHLRNAFMDVITRHTQVENNGFAQSTQTGVACEIQLHGALLIVQCATEALALELHNVAQLSCTKVSNVTTQTEEEQDTRTRYVRLPITHTRSGPQIHTCKSSHTPSNRKQFTQKIRNDDALTVCKADNIAKHNGQH